MLLQLENKFPFLYVLLCTYLEIYCTQSSTSQVVIHLYYPFRLCKVQPTDTRNLTFSNCLNKFYLVFIFFFPSPHSTEVLRKMFVRFTLWTQTCEQWPSSKVGLVGWGVRWCTCECVSWGFEKGIEIRK